MDTETFCGNYHIRYSDVNEYAVNFEVFEITTTDAAGIKYYADNQQHCVTLDKASPLLTGFLQWNGRCQVYFPNGWVTDYLQEIDDLCALLKHVKLEASKRVVKGDIQLVNTKWWLEPDGAQYRAPLKEYVDNIADNLATANNIPFILMQQFGIFPLREWGNRQSWVDEVIAESVAQRGHR